MEIIIGNYSGFCQGVQHTYDEAIKVLQKGNTYCLGKLIHNNQVVKELEDLGMIIAEHIEEIPDNSKTIFRAHGEPPKSYEYAKKHNIEVIDLTCGKVKLIHDKVTKEKEQSFIIIIGKKEHPEIIGTKGFSGHDSIIIENKEDISSISEQFIKSQKKKIYIISQTTFSSNKFDELVKEIKKAFKNIDIKIDKTICYATEKRQNEVFELSKNSNKVLIVGSNNSSNTRELYNIAKNNCQNTYFIENEEDILNIPFTEEDKVSVFGGASVPKHLIDSVTKKIKKKVKI